MLQRGAGPHSQVSATRRFSASHPGAHRSFSRTNGSPYSASSNKVQILGRSEHSPLQPLHLPATEVDREELLPKANANEGTSLSISSVQPPEPSLHMPPLDEPLEVPRPPTPPLPPPSPAHPPSDRPPTPPLPPNLASPLPTASPHPPTPPLGPPPEVIPPANHLHPLNRPVDNTKATGLNGDTLTHAFSLENYDAGRYVSATRTQPQPHHPLNPRKRKSSISTSSQSHTSEIKRSGSKSAPTLRHGKQKAKRSRIRQSLPPHDHSISERVPFPLPPRPSRYPENAAPNGPDGPIAPSTSSAGRDSVASRHGAEKNKNKKGRPSSLPPGSVEGRSMGSISDRSPVTQTVTTLPNGGSALPPVIPVHPPVPVSRPVPVDPRIPSKPHIPVDPRIPCGPRFPVDPRMAGGSRVFTDSRASVKPHPLYIPRAPVDPAVPLDPRTPVDPRTGRPGSRPVSRQTTPAPIINGKPEANHLAQGPTSMHKSENKGTVVVPPRNYHDKQSAQQTTLRHPGVSYVPANIQGASALESLQKKPLSQSEAFLAAKAEIEARKFSGNAHTHITSSNVNVSGAADGLPRSAGSISVTGQKVHPDALADDDNEPKHFRLPKHLLALFKVKKGLTDNVTDSTTSPDVNPPKAAMSATVEPATVEPAVVEPTAVEPTAIEPTAVEPTAVEPATVDAVAVVPTPKMQPIDNAPVAEPLRPSDPETSQVPLRVDESRELHKAQLPLLAGAKPDARPSAARKKPSASADGGLSPARPPKKRKEGPVTTRKRKQAPIPPEPSHAPPARKSEPQARRKIKQVINISSGLFPPAIIEEIGGLPIESSFTFKGVDFGRRGEGPDDCKIHDHTSPVDPENLFAGSRDLSPSVSSQATQPSQPSLERVREPLFLSRSPTPYSESPPQKISFQNGTAVQVKEEAEIAFDRPDPAVSADPEAEPSSIGMRSAQVDENGVVTVNDQWPDDSRAVVGLSGADEADELLKRYQLIVDRESTPTSLDIVLSRSSTEDELTDVCSSPEIPLASLRFKNLQAWSWRNKSHGTLDRLSVVLPISKARRRKLIQRGIYGTALN